MSQDIYDKYRDAFSDVSAFVITNNLGARVANVTFKHPRNSTRCTCYFQIFGSEMVCAFVGGGGYDKFSSAADFAVHKIKPNEHTSLEAIATIEAMQKAITDAGHSWDRELTRAGFNVLQAV